MVVAIVGASLFGVFASSAAAASLPPIENLSPTNGSAFVVQPHQEVTVEFTCPKFQGAYTGGNWSSYSVEFATNPELNPEGKFATPFTVWSGTAFPTNVAEDHCRASLSSYLAEHGGTFYWRVHRLNCEGTGSCAEYGPIWSFVTEKYVPPAPPTAPPAGSGGSWKVFTYTGCGLESKTRENSVCGRHAKIGAFFKSTQATTYAVCVRFPGGHQLCAESQQAEAGVLYVNKITASQPGRYTVTWYVGNQKFVKHVQRKRR